MNLGPCYFSYLQSYQVLYLIPDQGHERGGDQASVLHEDEVKPGHHAEAGVGSGEAEDLGRLGLERKRDSQDDKFREVTQQQR